MPVPALTWCGISRMSTMGIVKRLKPGVWESPRPSVSRAAAVSSRLKSSATRRLMEPALRSQRSLPLKHQHSHDALVKCCSQRAVANPDGADYMDPASTPAHMA